MYIKSYQEKAWSFAMPSAKNHKYVYYGLVAEVGELFGKEAKQVRDGINYDEKELKKELGDILWCVAAVASINGWDLEEIAEMNVKKLQARQEFGTLGGSGDNR